MDARCRGSIEYPAADHPGTGHLESNCHHALGCPRARGMSRALKPREILTLFAVPRIKDAVESTDIFVDGAAM